MFISFNRVFFSCLTDKLPPNALLEAVNNVASYAVCRGVLTFKDESQTAFFEDSVRTAQ
jgi:hypothetical protein